MRILHNLVVFSVIILTTLISCSKEEVDTNPDFENYFIKSEIAADKAVSKYIYNRAGKITERQSVYSFSKYTYDNNSRLVKCESAIDPTMISATSHVRTDLMTSQHAEMTSYQIFEYEASGRLKKTENYFKKNNDFEHTSIYSFEYDGNNIVRVNLHNEKDIITQFHTYQYDNKGNVITEKYYSSLHSAEPHLISETFYKYDNKNNPFRIFAALGIPGLYTNANNIIESNSILHEETPGISTYSTSKTDYTYNQEAFPVKVISGNSNYEYTYK